MKTVPSLHVFQLFIERIYLMLQYNGNTRLLIYF